MPAVTLLPRQGTTDGGTIIIPTTYSRLNNSLAPWAIVGITLGSVAGFLLIFFFIYSIMGFAPAVIPADTVSVRERPSSRKHRSHSHSRRRQSSGPRVSATYETRTRTRTREEPVVNAPPPPRVVHESSDDDDDEEDEVVVIEEHDPRPRRHSSRRSRRGDGYRDVRPDEYAPGDEPMRPIRRDGSRRR